MRSMCWALLGVGLVATSGCGSGLQNVQGYKSDTDSDVPTPGVPGDTDDPDDNNNNSGDENRAPYADAGPDQTVADGATVHLDGSGSSDADGDSLDFVWEIKNKPAGSQASLINSTRDDPSFWADLEGEYVIELTVDDGEDSDSDTVIITAEVNNAPPTANAGGNQTVRTGDTVYLSGANSFDAEGDPLTYRWTMTNRPIGSGASLTSASAVNSAFVADVDGIYAIELIVNDGRADSVPSLVSITATTSTSGGGGSSGGLCLAMTPVVAGMPLLILLGWRREDDEPSRSSD